MSEQYFIRNIDFAKVVDLEALVDYQEGRVVSRTLAQGRPLSVTLFAFDKGEEISTHSAPVSFFKLRDVQWESFEPLIFN